MKYYFTLQYKILNRHLRAFGLYPILGYLLGVILFVAGSLYLFSKTEYAAYIYAFLALSPLSLLSETKRTDFLKSCFSVQDYSKIRMSENLILIFPFLIFLGFKKEWLVLLGLTFVAILLAKIHFKNQLNYTIPTPFYKKPFEFIIGFRTAIGMIGFAYFLTIMGISVGNFNLGIFSLLVVFLTSFSFYAQPDSQFYVWIFSHSSATFLLDKIKIGIGYITILALPILLGLGYFFPEKWRLLLLFLGLGYLYLSTIILAKYAAFPRAMNLPESIFIVVSVLFPPFLLFVIPFFYRRSIKNLNTILA